MKTLSDIEGLTDGRPLTKYRCKYIIEIYYLNTRILLLLCTLTVHRIQSNKYVFSNCF